MIVEIKAAAKVGDSLGGIVEVIAYGVPVGLGSHVHWDRKLDGLLAGALMSIQAVKAVEIGDGFIQASQRGSVAHDAIAYDESFDQGGGFIRRTDHAGGTEGGISSGRADHRQGRDEAALHAESTGPRDRGRRDARDGGLVQGAHRRHGGAGAGRGHRGDDGARLGQRGPAQVRRRLGRGVHAQPRVLHRQPRLDAVGRSSAASRGTTSSSSDCPVRERRRWPARSPIAGTPRRSTPTTSWRRAVGTSAGAVPARRGRSDVSACASSTRCAPLLDGDGDAVVATGGGIVCSPRGARDRCATSSRCGSTATTTSYSPRLG